MTPNNGWSIVSNLKTYVFNKDRLVTEQFTIKADCFETALMMLTQPRSNWTDGFINETNFESKLIRSRYKDHECLTELSEEDYHDPYVCEDSRCLYCHP